MRAAWVNVVHAPDHLTVRVLRPQCEIVCRNVAQPVDVKTLDASIAHPVDFIKIDVEGSELLVFQGAERILVNDRPSILVEINPSNLMRTSGVSATEFGRFVEGLDYCLYDITASGGCGRRIEPSELSKIQTLVNMAMLPKERIELTAAS